MIFDFTFFQVEFKRKKLCHQCNKYYLPVKHAANPTMCSDCAFEIYRQRGPQDKEYKQQAQCIPLSMPRRLNIDKYFDTNIEE